MEAAGFGEVEAHRNERSPWRVVVVGPVILLTGATVSVGSALLRRRNSPDGRPVRRVGARPAQVGRAARARTDRARRPGGPALLPQRPARRRDGRAHGGLDPRPAASVDRGAERASPRCAWCAPAERAGAQRFLFFSAMSAQPPLAHSLLPGQGTSPRRRSRSRPLDTTVFRAVDRLHAGRSLAHAARPPLAAAGRADLGLRAKRSTSRSGRRTWRTAVIGALSNGGVRELRPGRPGARSRTTTSSGRRFARAVADGAGCCTCRCRWSERRCVARACSQARRSSPPGRRRS